jgi:hypothetical protein
MVLGGPSPSRLGSGGDVAQQTECFGLVPLLASGPGKSQSPLGDSSGIVQSVGEPERRGSSDSVPATRRWGRRAPWPRSQGAGRRSVARGGSPVSMEISQPA